jgi:hypothetical protein
MTSASGPQGGRRPDAFLAYATGGFASIVSELEIHRESKELVLDSGFCRGGRRLLTETEMAGLWSAVRELEAVAASASGTPATEAPALELDIDGSEVGIVEVESNPAPAMAKTLDVIDELLIRRFGKRCRLDPDTPWREAAQQ